MRDFWVAISVAGKESAGKLGCEDDDSAEPSPAPPNSTFAAARGSTAGASLHDLL